MKLLLCSVFGPYGVDDQDGRRLNVMELFHNQVTREQGLFSLRMNHPTFGLHMIAENLQVPTVVLDFPSWEAFKKEVERQYDVIGIASIVANIGKVKKMIEFIRRASPKTKIVVGGFCTGVEGIQQIVGADYISTGEGVSWFRRFFKEDPAQPVKHPALYSTLNRRVMGVPVPNTAAVLIPGLGCVNACSFCATSHHFGKRYLGYMNSGQEVFSTLQELERKLDTREFFVMDENFLKHRPRAEELLQAMIEADKYYYLGVFSSAETIRSVGVEFMAKLGIDFVWVGVESKASMFTKTQGVDLKALIRELRDYGIQVLGSGILFMEHHTPENMHEDIDFLIDLNTDFVQFMNLGPLPGTALYESMESQGRIRHDLPFMEWHGQDKIWFEHPCFSSEETGAIIKQAFAREYEQQGPSLLRLAETALRGYRTVKNHADRRLKGLAPRLKERCLTFRPLFAAAHRFAQNQKTRDMVSYLTAEYKKEFGRTSFVDAAASLIVTRLAGIEAVGIADGKTMRQPPTKRTQFRMKGCKATENSLLLACDLTNPDFAISQRR